MDANEIPEACEWFGETMNRCQNWDEAKPVMFFGAQVAGHRWMELRGAAPDHPHVQEWANITRTVLAGAVEMHPDDAVARHNYGRFLQDIGEIDEALVAYRHTLLLDPAQVETWGNLADLYYQKGDRTTAYECWERAIALPTDKASARLSQAYYWLRTGQWEQGWKAFNDRWNDMVFVRGYGRDKEFGKPHWLGGPLPKSARLFVHGEQGLGDHVMFSRYIPLLLERGLNVVGLETRSVLKRWMAASFPTIPVFARDVDERPEFTHHVSTMDLPAIFGTTVETVPPPVTGTIAKLREWEPSYDTMRVGIAWEGARGNAADSVRSIPAELLAELADIPGVTWVNLQFSPDASITSRAWLGPRVVDGTDGCTDALDTAAVMRGLDLVVTVDTATAHLAGTLGIPTWILHRFAREWRWLDPEFYGETCPWYPSVRSLTQPAPNDWRSLLRRVRSEIERLAVP